MGSNGDPPDPAPHKAPVLTDEEYDLKQKEVALYRQHEELNRARDRLRTEQENRELRGWFAKGAVVVMLVQIVAANAIFVWYGDTNGWQIGAAAISAWLGATAVQVVGVVLVVMNYLFPRGGSPE